MTTNRIQPVGVTLGVGYHVGLRRAHKPNQDTVGSYADIAPDERHLASKGLLYIVADGMGGAAGGELASQMAVHITLTKYYQNDEPNVARSLAKAVQIANQKIHERGHSDPVSWGMGTTIVAAVLHNNQLNVLNVGDSRAYLLRNGEMKLISTDHSLVQEQVRAGLLTAEEAAIHPRRNVLSRNLGYAAQTYPDSVTYTLRKGDILLLCSDGLWGQVNDDELADFLQSHEPQMAADKLVDLANQRGGPDNISIIILRVDDLLFVDDDDITDPTPLLASTEHLLDEDDTDPTPLLHTTEKIQIHTSGHHLQIPTNNDSTHVFTDHTTRKLRVPDRHVGPSDYNQSSSATSALSDSAPNRVKSIIIWSVIIFLIALFVFFGVTMLDMWQATFLETMNAFSINQ